MLLRYCHMGTKLDVHFPIHLHNLVGTFVVTRLRIGRQMAARDKGFSLLRMIQTGSAAHSLQN